VAHDSHKQRNCAHGIGTVASIQSVTMVFTVIRSAAISFSSRALLYGICQLLSHSIVTCQQMLLLVIILFVVFTFFYFESAIRAQSILQADVLTGWESNS
jgi:uncharacterized membrane protein